MSCQVGLNLNLKVSETSNPRHFWKKTPDTVKSSDVLTEITGDDGLGSKINIFEPTCELDSPEPVCDLPKYNPQLLSNEFSIDSDILKSNLASGHGSPKKLAILKKIYNRMFAGQKCSLNSQIGLVEIKPWSGVQSPTPELSQHTTAKKTPNQGLDSGEKPNLSTADNLTAKKTTNEIEGFGIERENFQLQFQQLEHIRFSSRHLLRSPDRDTTDFTMITEENDPEPDLEPDTPTLLPKKIQYDAPSLKTSVELLTIKKQPQYPNLELDPEFFPQDKLESDLNLTNFELDLSKIASDQISFSAPNFFHQGSEIDSQNPPSQLTGSEFDIDTQEFDILEIEPTTKNPIIKRSITPLGSPMVYSQEYEGARPRTARPLVSAYRSTADDDESICQEDISYTLDMIKWSIGVGERLGGLGECLTADEMVFMGNGGLGDLEKTFDGFELDGLFDSDEKPGNLEQMNIQQLEGMFKSLKFETLCNKVKDQLTRPKIPSEEMQSPSNIRKVRLAQESLQLAEQHSQFLAQDRKIFSALGNPRPQNSPTHHKISKKPYASNIVLEKNTLKYEGFYIKCLQKDFDLIFDGRLSKFSQKKEGFGRLLYKSGNLFYQGDFLDGEIYGSSFRIFHDMVGSKIMMEFDSNGDEDAGFDCANGKLCLYWKNGGLSFEGQLQNGLKFGLCREFRENGSLEREMQYSQGYPENRCCDRLVVYKEEVIDNSWMRKVDHLMVVKLAMWVYVKKFGTPEKSKMKKSAGPKQESEGNPKGGLFSWVYNKIPKIL
jgi:hypothetical protein